MRRLISAAAFALLAAGCAEQDVGEPADAPPATEPAAEAPAPSADPRRVTAEGVGPIGARTLFDRETIAALFPGADVETAFLHQGEDTTPIITVYGEAVGSLEIQGAPDGYVSQVIVSGGPFRGPDGQALLAAWPDLGLTAADCAMGEGRFLGAQVCRRAEAPNLAYVLSVPGWRGDGLPDATTLNGRAALREFVWTRPGA